MNKNNIDIALRWMESYSSLVKFKILICGGDGSVGWILSSISNHNFNVREIVFFSIKKY